MRVLHVNKFLHRRGGAEGYMLDLAELQREHGHEVAFFGMDHPDNDQSSVGTLASHVEFEPPPDGVVARGRLVGRMIWSRSAARGMVEALEEFRPDVVHAHNVYHQLSPSVISVARRRGVPVVLTMHDYKLACPTYQFLDHGKPCTACVSGGPWQAARRACKDGSRAASTAAALEVSLHRTFGAYDGVRRFIAPSRFLAAQVSAAGVHPDRIRVQPNFTDLDASPSTGGPGRGAVFAGRLSPEKGVDTLIRAVARATGLGALAPGGVILDIAGDGPERGALEALARSEAPGRVRFRGRLAREELQALVREAVLSVVPSRWYENQPLAVLESFALGVPVLSTDLGGLPELVDESTGWVVGANDPEAMGRVLAAALADPEDAFLRGTRARRFVEERHDPKSHLAGITAIYEQAGEQS
jgi:glycosyltransferase involved in cell wall biosynthesis